MIRYPIVLLLVLGLSACGFHLRSKLALPEDLPPVAVVSSTPYSKLADMLARGLKVAGATIAPDNATEGVARLELLSERWGDLPIAIDAEGRAQEFSLRYAVIFVFHRPDGTELVPQQVVELSRDYVSPPQDATGTTTEREVLADELRREMSASILRRIDSVVRAELEQQAKLPGSAAPAVPPADADKSVPAAVPASH